MTTPLLFTPLSLRDVTLRNRVVIAPMAMYSAVDGVAQDFHFAHWGRLILGGAGCVFVEATAVTEQGRITNGDLGIWSDGQIPGLKRVADFMKTQKVVPAIQLAHAGRKGSMQRPWFGNGALTAEDLARGEKKWDTVAPTATPMAEGHIVPHPLSIPELARLKDDWVAAAKRAIAAGFDLLEIHNAHGYLLHQFLSPVTNTRSDEYGGDLEGRMRFPLEIAEALRETWPRDKPVFVRVSAVDGVEGGWTLDDTVTYAKELKARGIDVVDCSSGGLFGRTYCRSVFRRGHPPARESRLDCHCARGAGQSVLAADGRNCIGTKTHRCHGGLAGAIRLVAQTPRAHARANSRRRRIRSAKLTLGTSCFVKSRNASATFDHFQFCLEENLFHRARLLAGGGPAR